MAEQRFGPIEPVADGPVGEMHPAGRLPPVLARVEVDLERLDQLLAHPRVREQGSELALDDHGGELSVTQQQTLDSKLGQIIDDRTSTDRVGNAQTLLELEE